MGLRQLILGFLSAFALAFVPSAANAGHDEPRQIDVPAGNLIASINSLARQTGVTIGGARSRSRVGAGGAPGCFGRPFGVLREPKWGSGSSTWVPDGTPGGSEAKN